MATKTKSTKPAKKAKEAHTMICLILDRSGSMAGRESDVIGGVAWKPPVA